MKNGVRENILKCISFVHFVSNKTDHFVFCCIFTVNFPPIGLPQ